MGVALKSKLPNNTSYADNDWLLCADHNNLMVILNSGRSLFHSLTGILDQNYSSWQSNDFRKCVWNVL